MTMNMSELRELVAQKYSEVEQIDDSVLCFTRRRNNRPFAIYYFDISDDLPNTKESLNQYQDHLIGKRYFDGQKSLQWSNYLYFLRSEEALASSVAKQAKELIENDRTYARKFVIQEQEIDSVLAPHANLPSSSAKYENILSVWMKLLSESNLDQSIIGDDDLPTRLRLIEENNTLKDEIGPIAKIGSVKPAQFLKSFHLSKYRSYPLTRNFEFGNVNLIFGPNASGKTSLLEAIELFYCGRNKRNPDQKSTYKIDAVLANGSAESATSQRDLNIFRERNLSWYGQAEIRTNYLYKSFAQFNFLDTDAAVSLSQSNENIEEDLSKLLVGPDTSKVWRNIERVSGGVQSKLKELSPYKNQIEAELSRLDSLVNEFKSERHESDIILDQLIKMLSRQNWKIMEGDPEVFLESLIGSLTELISVAQQAIELGWVESPVTYRRIDDFVEKTLRVIGLAEPKVTRKEEIEKEKSSLIASLGKLKNAETLGNEIVRYIDSGFLLQTSNQANARTKIEKYSKRLLSYNNEFTTSLSEVESDKSVLKALKTASEECEKLEREYSDAEKEYQDFSKLRTESVNLSQQLRQIAGKLIRDADNPDRCPLCHTQLASGELEARMNFGIDTQFESIGQSLLSRITSLKELLKKSRTTEAALLWLKGFCQNEYDSADCGVKEALSKLKYIQKELALAQESYESANVELMKLALSGVSAEGLNEILTKLNRMGYRLEDYKRESVNQLLLQIENHSSFQSESIKKVTNELDLLEVDLRMILNLTESNQDFAGAISVLREEITVTEAIKARLSEIYAEFIWPHDRSISDQISIADAILKVGSRAHTAIVHEHGVSRQLSESLKRQEELKKKLKKLNKRIDRFSGAQAVFNKIIKNYSLNNAMREALNLNRDAIEKIFSCIHSPAEFSGLGPTITTLIRKVDNDRAKLTEISTGQRAAFGLSVFLAQNSQLTTAPPVVIIDDPIAHVDDLNSLSFLDYLREISLTDKRQIFFATANDKLATLFERKFDFLGESQFKRFNLFREI